MSLFRKLRFECLEERETPAVYSHDGNVVIGGAYAYRPFGAFNAANYTAGFGDTYVVGAAPGGGPRVQVVTQSGNSQPAVQADFFAFETTFHGGVHVSTDGQYVVAGAATQGGPVVAVYDTHGNPISRFFAFDPAFRGGVDVEIYQGVIYVTAGVGGGPVVEEFNIHGTSLGAFFGAPSDLRTGFDVIVSPDVIGVTTVNLVQPNGTLYVNYPGLGQYKTRLPGGFTWAGYSGAAFQLGGNGYITNDAIDIGFNHLASLFYPDNHAAGNPNPPPTTGFRPGKYFSAVSPFAAGNSSISSTSTSVLPLSGESVGSKRIGTGTAFVPMKGPDGTTYVVTASHVTDLNQNELIAPGPADGTQLIDYGYPTIWTFYRAGPYSVDAAAVPTTLPLKSAVLFDGVYYPIDGFAEPKVGQAIVAVGRGSQAGVGIYAGPQGDPVNVDTGYVGGAQLSGQYVVGPSLYSPLAIPGFSGGPAFTITVDATGIHRYLIGMVIAGNGQTTYVTPLPKIEAALGLEAVFN